MLMVFEDKNNLYYIGIHYDDCDIVEDKDIADELGLTWKSYQNILLNFNASFDFMGDCYYFNKREDAEEALVAFILIKG